MKDKIFVGLLLLLVSFSFAQTKVSGNCQAQDINIDYQNYLERKNRNDYSRDSIFALITKIKNDKTNDELNNAEEILFEAKIENLQVLLNNTIVDDMLNEFKYISINRSFAEAPMLLAFRLKRSEGKYQYEKIKVLFDNLTENVRLSLDGVNLKNLLFTFKSSSIGNSAPEFSLYDMDNNLVKLSEFKNKNFLLLDFWASWCAPCREDFPFLKELISIHPQMKIVSISRDENINSWKKAVNNEGINSWINISTVLNLSDIEKHYFVNAIPVKILISKEGNIVGRWIGGGNENKEQIMKKIEELICKNNE